MIILRQKLYRQEDIVNKYLNNSKTPVILINPNTGLFTREDLSFEKSKKLGLIARLKKAITKNNN